ncbi:hypothetical protein PS3A_38170 [Pseudomonas sp. 3A(2025)]
MGNLKCGAVIVAVVGILPGLYMVFWLYSSWAQGYTWAEMDWDGDGSTDVSEIFLASDIARRTIVVEGHVCVEYFRFKDGLPEKVVYEDRLRSR